MEIVRLSNSNRYVIGEVLYRQTDKNSINTLVTSKYEHTFLYKYISYIRNLYRYKPHLIDYKLNNNNIKTAVNILFTMLKKNDWTLAPRDTLVIHVRLGDVFNNSKTPIAYDNLQPNKANLLTGINKSQKKKIVIVTALHFGTCRSINDEDSKETSYDDVLKKYNVNRSDNKSKDFLEDFIESIPKDKEVSVRSSESIDIDFAYLCSADELLISGKSAFALSAKMINIYLRNEQLRSKMKGEMANYILYKYVTSQIL